MIRKLLIAALATLASSSAFAVYNANGAFVITSLMTYADTDSIYIQVASPPSNPACNNSFFVISGALPENRRNAMLARLMLAKATGEAVNFGYDATGDCAEGYLRVHRIG